MAALKLFMLLCFFQSIHNASAWTNVSWKLKDLVVHFESIREGFEKSWIIRSAYHDSEWSYYSKFTQYSDTEVMSAEQTKFLVSSYIISLEFVFSKGFKIKTELEFAILSGINGRDHFTID